MRDELKCCSQPDLLAATLQPSKWRDADGDSREWREPRRKGRTSPCTNTRRGNEEQRRSELKGSALTFDLSGPPKAGPLEGRVGRHRATGGVLTGVVASAKGQMIACATMTLSPLNVAAGDP
jgi:hypothetical protein